MGVSPGAATEELAAGVLLLGGSGCRAAGDTDGGSGDGCVRWAAGTSLLGTPSSPVLCGSPASAAPGGTRPACHVGVENSPTLLQTV